jgi:hypothetical protein
MNIQNYNLNTLDEPSIVELHFVEDISKFFSLKKILYKYSFTIYFFILFIMYFLIYYMKIHTYIKYYGLLNNIF